jgi:hypothetical protein
MFYDATVRPAGQITHEVPKVGLSAAEVVILRSIHGDDGVVHLRPSKSARPAGDERARLIAVYGEKVVGKVFGSTYGSALPQEVPADWMPSEEAPDWARATAA